jgi:EmrB/QacA subfamily drug resistance transporter
MAQTEKDAAERAAAEGRFSPALLKLMGVMTLGSIMIQLDQTMTNVAFNALLRQFDATLLTIQWVGTAYTLAMAAVIPLTGWALDRYGARRIWIVCIALFLIGSTLCGFAWSADSLIAFRVVQGLGGGMVLPLGTAILAQAAGPERLGRVMGAIGIPAILSPILGPVLGGVLVSDLSWRWIFFVNFPVCVAAILLWRVVPGRETTGTARLDALGVALLSPACAIVVYGFTEAGRHGSFGDRHAVVPLAAGIVLLVLYVVHALRTRAEPVIDVRLFRKLRTFTSATAVMFIGAIALFGDVAMMPLYYQQVRGFSALHAGSLMIPQGIGMGVALLVASTLTDRIAPRPIVLVGLFLTAVSTIVYLYIGVHTSVLLLSLALLLSGAGLGAVLVPVMAVAVRGLSKEAIPRATTASRILMQIGGAFGGAVLLIVLQTQITDHAKAGRLNPAGLASSYGHTFWWVLVFTVAASLAAVFLPGTPPQKGEGGPEVIVL